ncbi:MAG: adenylate/guanylate cyclase domain-containing protein [Balneola sp.]|nr:MAG: adenylate/guanylate cyclase domain-containing protein [Balneola sp.]
MKSSPKRKKGVAFYIVIASAAFFLSLLIASTEQVQKIELSLRDYLFEIRGPLSVEDSPIVMVAISENADSEIPEKWPWPTSIHAKLVHNLNRAGAKAILFDVLFTQQDSFDPRNDTLFAEAIAEYGNVILAGDVEDIIEINRPTSSIFPLPVLREDNPNQLGFVSTFPYLDGYVRTYNIGRRYQGTDYLMLGLQGLRLFNDIPDEEIDEFDQNSKNEFFKLGPYQIQRDNLNSFIVNFYGSEGMFQTVSYEEVIDDSSYTTIMEQEIPDINSFDNPDFGDGHLQLGTFKDKIVIVGATMPTLQDFHATPFASAELPRPGFEIHAHAIQTILDGTYISRQKNGARILIILVCSFLIVFANRSLGLGWSLGLMLLLIGGIYGASIFLFLQYSLMISVTGVWLSVLIGQGGTIGYEYFNEQKEKRRIKGMFSSYVSPQLVDQMIDSGEEPKLGGEEAYITAFFSDIVSFSTFSEKLEPKQLVSLINEYLTAMTDIINTQGGTLDKFIGDAIVAFFGAPVQIPDHALKACISSQLMERRLNELREKWKKDNWIDIVWNMQHRMGMNTGEMVTGNMGSERRFNYTIMGDNVNLAARCESGAKQYNVYTMLTETTKQEAEKYGNDCVFRMLDNIVVKGRSRPVKVYEIAGLRADASQQLLESVGLYELGMENYFKQEWDEAIKYFSQSLPLEAHPKNPSQIFLERCEFMKQNPPSLDWDGVFVMTSK